MIEVIIGTRTPSKRVSGGYGEIKNGTPSTFLRNMGVGGGDTYGTKDCASGTGDTNGRHDGFRRAR